MLLSSEPGMLRRGELVLVAAAAAAMSTALAAGLVAVASQDQTYEVRGRPAGSVEEEPSRTTS
jgi:hypothetical protein